MRRIWAIAAFAALVVAGCTGSSGGDPSSPAPTTSASPSSTPPSTPVTAPTSPPRTSDSPPGPPHPTRPHVPADVPRTGHNTKPGEKPPVEPLEATQHTPRGAKAFAAFFIKTIDWGYATTSSAYMRHYYQPSCTDCRITSASLDNARRDHQYYVGSRITVVDRGGSRRGGPDRAERTVVLYIDISAVELIDRHGRGSHADAPYHRYRQQLSMAWRHGAWSVVAVYGNAEGRR